MNRWKTLVQKLWPREGWVEDVLLHLWQDILTQKHLKKWSVEKDYSRYLVKLVAATINYTNNKWSFNIIKPWVIWNQMKGLLLKHPFFHWCLEFVSVRLPGCFLPSSSIETRCSVEKSWNHETPAVGLGDGWKWNQWWHSCFLILRLLTLNRAHNAF